MEESRTLQVTLNNIVGATRFKVLVGGKLAKTKCQRQGCGEADSWEHFQQCYEVPSMEGLTHSEKAKAIVAICKKAEVPDPIRPKPWNPVLEVHDESENQERNGQWID